MEWPSLHTPGAFTRQRDNSQLSFPLCVVKLKATMWTVKSPTTYFPMLQQNVIQAYNTYCPALDSV